MRLLRQKLKIYAPIEHVYSCSTDISYLKKEMARQADGRNIKIKYNTPSPFGKGNELTFLLKEPVIKLVILENIQHKFIKASITPYASSIKFLGDALMEVRFLPENSATTIEIEITSEKRLKLLWCVFIKIMVLSMKITSRKDEKRFVKYVESTARQTRQPYSIHHPLIAALFRLVEQSHLKNRKGFQMSFFIDSEDAPEISDSEIVELLWRVYVDGGFTEPEVAEFLFEPSAVRKRGKLISARRNKDLELTGMVIVAYPDSPALRLASSNESEMHLLAVKPQYRGRGLGRALIAAAIENATQGGYAKMLLATQPTMRAAHRLYESCGFIRVSHRDYSRRGRDFLVYEKILNTLQTS